MAVLDAIGDPQKAPCVFASNPFARWKAAADTAKNSDSFLPPASVRGDIARCMFYMALRYDGTEPETNNLTLTSCPCPSRNAMGNLTRLLEWHAADPVDDAERTRSLGDGGQLRGNFCG